MLKVLPAVAGAALVSSLLWSAPAQATLMCSGVFSYTGQVVDCVVASTGEYSITAYGAQGGANGGGAAGGLGAQMGALMTLEQGDVLELLVGGMGSQGGRGGGGGGTFVALWSQGGTELTTPSALLVAGGGGGHAAGGEGATASTGNAGISTVNSYPDPGTTLNAVAAGGTSGSGGGGGAAGGGGGFSGDGGAGYDSGVGGQSFLNGGAGGAGNSGGGAGGFGGGGSGGVGSGGGGGGGYGGGGGGWNVVAGGGGGSYYDAALLVAPDDYALIGAENSSNGSIYISESSVIQTVIPAPNAGNTPQEYSGTDVPEPASLALLGMALLGLAIARRVA